MTERPYWPVCEVRKAANGWLVRPGASIDNGRISPSDDFYVFQRWDDCQQFLCDVTTAASPART